MEREKRIYMVTAAGSLVNAVLLISKFLAGIFGGSAAMIADAVHSLSDFLTDIVVFVFVRISSKPEDEDHDYGHGKYETLATVLIGLSLLVVGALLLESGVEKVFAFIRGEQLASPGIIALIAALVSIALKEWCFRFTAKVGRETESQAVIANAWHHRSDALSSIGTAVGIGGAILLGERWAVLDPVAAILVSCFIIVAAVKLMGNAAGDLMEKSLPEQVENRIKEIVLQDGLASEVHHLKTRRLGSRYAIEMHLRMPGGISLYESHRLASEIEKKLRDEFGPQTHIGLHVEPLKTNGKYIDPEYESKN